MSVHSQVEVGHQLPKLTLGCFLADIARRHGDREAMVFGDRRSSYRQLEADARRLARALIGAGVVKGSRVAVLAGSRPEWIESFFAAGLVGAVMVPINTFASRDELDYILRHSDASLLILQPSLLKHRFLTDLVAAHPELSKGEPGRLRCRALPQLRRVVSTSLPEPCGTVEALEDLLKLGGDVSDGLLDEVASEVTASDDAIIIYTSGTTARPKAVLHSHRAPLINGLRFSSWMGLSPDHRVWSAQPFFWTAGITMSLLSTLDAGGCLVLQEAFEPGQALDMIEGERVTTLHAWAHQQKALAEHPSYGERDLSSIGRAGESGPAGEKTPARREFGLEGSYGLSETFTIFATLPRDAPRELRQETSGRPLPGNQVRIVDPETRRELSTGEHGEITLRGATFMRGYYKLEPEEYLDANGFFGTKDGGFLDEEGYLHWTGRISTMIKTGGANVSPLEVEAALAEFQPLRVGMAVGVPHPTLDEVIVLCAVTREDAGPVSEDQVRTHLRSRLAAYKVPRRVLFFRADELSYTGNQKIQYGPLREQALARLRAEGIEIEGHVYRAEA